MKILKSCAIAFSMFSGIPVPQFEWEEDNMKYVLCFFPWVGAVIGICVSLWFFLCKRFGIGNTAYVFVAAAIPIAVTGGIHVDGFMDTMDALHSYGSRERKLEILKDSHIGAFAVIRLFLYYLVYMAAFSEIRDGRTVAVLAVGFALSRVLSGIGAVTLRSAKEDGTLKTLSDNAGKKAVMVLLAFQFVLCAAGMLALSFWTGLFTVAGAVLSFWYYRYMSYRKFGGVTGDTAGYFVLICEEVMVVAAAVCGYFH